jgi:hypothetical protein
LPVETLFDVPSSSDTFHDRIIILDEALLYHMGASLNYAGRKTFAINRIEDREYIASLLRRLEENKHPVVFVLRKKSEPVDPKYLSYTRV